MTTLLWILGVFLFIGFTVTYFQEKSKKKKKRKQSLALESIPDFNSSRTVLTEFGFIALDYEAKKVAMGKSGFKTEVIPVEDIYKIEVVEDGKTVFEKKNVLTRSAVGFALGGLVGAAIGGGTASSKAKKTVSKIELKVHSLSLSGDVFVLKIFDARNVTNNAKKEVSLDSIYKQDVIKASERAKQVISSFEMMKESN